MIVVVPMRRWIARSSNCISSQLGVEIGHRLVEQEHGGRDDDRSRKGDALPLSARKLTRKALRKRFEPHECKRLAHALVAFLFAHAPHLQAEAHVLRDRHVRKQRIALKDDAQAALVRLHIGDVAAVEHDAPARRLHETGDHLQRGGLAAARGAEQGDEFAFLHR